MKVLNPNNLALAPITDFNTTQGDLKFLSKSNYQKLKNAIEKHGFDIPIYVWEDDQGKKWLLDGHQRKRLLEKEGWLDPIPYLIIKAPDMQIAAERLLEITSQYGTITQEGLDAFLGTFELPDFEIKELTNFDGIMDFKIDEPEPTEPLEVEELPTPEVDKEHISSQNGKVYKLGPHKIACGDSTDTELVDRLFDKATIAFTSPPYNAGVQVEQNRKGKKKYSEYDDANADWLSLMDNFQKIQIEKTTYQFINTQILAKNKVDTLHFLELYHQNFVDVLFWAKDWAQPAMASNVMNSQMELIWIFKNEEFPKRSIATGDFRGTVPNLITTKRNMGNKFSEHNAATMHIDVAVYVIQSFTKEGDSVYDAFCGTGTTILAADQLGRIGYGVELDPAQVDVIRKRYQLAMTGSYDGWEDATPEDN